MQNSNKHIEKFLDYYLNKEQSPDYAVLITGCWGSGKTYFIRKYLEGNYNRKELKKIKENSSSNGKIEIVDENNGEDTVEIFKARELQEKMLSRRLTG